MNRNNLDDRLNRIKGFIVPSGIPSGQRSLPSRYGRLAEGINGEIVSNHAGSFCRAVRKYPFGFILGDASLDGAGVSDHLPLASFSATEAEGSVALGDLIFFDLETTGLGGAGTVAFLVGFGSLTTDGFEVRQYVLPDYSDEAALLEQALTELGEDKTIVSYNGTAFDLNLIRDRMIINRVTREVPHRGHLDLLHSARRLFRRRLRDCSLVNIEREIFNFHRHDDIPGYLIPSVYFDWLASEQPGLLPVVLEHNRLDILSLYFLLQRVAEIFRDEGGGLCEPQDMYSLSRIYGRRGHHDKVTQMYDRLVSRTAVPLDREVKMYHAMAFKRAGDWSRAVGLWLEISEGDTREAFLAHLELAKYFEHQAKDPARAYGHARRARQICPQQGPHFALLERRLERLRSKTS